MHHTLAWRKSQADATAEDTTPVTDGIWTIQNGHFLPQVDWQIIYAYFGAASPIRARFITPTFRQITNPFIRPINPAIVPVDEPNMADYSMSPLRIRGLEELQIESIQTSGGAAVVVVVAGVTRTGFMPAPQGDYYTMRGTGTTTATAGAWSSVAVTWADTLPRGLFAVIGLEAFGTTMIAARLQFEDQIDRPGGLCQSLVSGNGPPLMRKGRLGIWGKFDSNRMPNVEVLCNAADTAQEFYLDIVRLQ